MTAHDCSCGWADHPDHDLFSSPDWQDALREVIAKRVKEREMDPEYQARLGYVLDQNKELYDRLAADD